MYIILFARNYIFQLEGDTPGEFCKAELINVDRLEVIVDSFNYVKHLWEKALCSSNFIFFSLYSKDFSEASSHIFIVAECFKNHSTALSDETTNLLLYLEATNKCINNTNDTSHSHDKICSNCQDFYFKLNYYYDNRGSYTAFCMDIIDAVNGFTVEEIAFIVHTIQLDFFVTQMNSSRVEWSVTLGCCTDRQKSEVLFLMTVIIALSTPILFYSLVWICSKRHLTQ